MKKKLVIIALLIVFLSPVSRLGFPAPPPPTVATPPPDISELIKQLESPDAGRRLEAKKVLVEAGPAAGQAIVEQLSSAAGQKAYDLMLILRHIKYVQGQGVLEKIWEGSRDQKVKLAAAMLLCRLGDDYLRYQGYIVKQVETGEEDQRLEAMQMLGYIEDARVVGVLEKIFYDQSQPDQIRQAAIWSLSFTPVPESARVLVAMNSDPEIDPIFWKPIIITAIQNLSRERELVPLINELLEEAQRLPSTRKKSQAPPAGE